LELPLTISVLPGASECCSQLVANLQSNLQYYCFPAFAGFCLQDVIFVCKIDAIMNLLRSLSIGRPPSSSPKESAWSFTCDLPVPLPQGPQTLHHSAVLTNWSGSHSPGRALQQDLPSGKSL
jgi:hypothetical protein